jgi:hypothetical protein
MVCTRAIIGTRTDGAPSGSPGKIAACLACVTQPRRAALPGDEFRGA